MSVAASPYTVTADRPASSALSSVGSPRWTTSIAWLIVIVLAATPFALAFTPWQQNIRASGRVVAFNPVEREQPVEAPISGRVVTWHVEEGDFVKAGSPLVELSDLDSNYLSNLQVQLSAALTKRDAYIDKAQSYRDQIQTLEFARTQAILAADSKVAAAEQKARAERQKVIAEQAKLFPAEQQQARLRNLREEGLASQREVEVAEGALQIVIAAIDAAKASAEAAGADIDVAKAERERTPAMFDASIRSAQANLNEARGQTEDARQSITKLEVDIARQESQVVNAPRDGFVQRVRGGVGGEIVKSGDQLMTLVPDTENRSVMLFIDANDAPLIRVGEPVRLQFEGWPAIQFGGWPGASYGTWGGVVERIDAATADDGAGDFRILVVPDGKDPWPDPEYLRQGVPTKSWVLLEEVTLGYEIWRQLNGFPMVYPKEEKQGVARKRVK